MNLSVYQAIIAAPFAAIGLRMAGDAVSAIDYLPADTPEQAPADAMTARIVEQLQAYFRDPHALFTVPLAVTGTAFQQQVWTALQAIPPGTVLTYGELAQQLGTAARAIGGACRANPVPILIPCHRVVAQHGLGGYAGAVTGDPLAIKRWLLRHEKVKNRFATLPPSLPGILYN